MFLPHADAASLLILGTSAVVPAVEAASGGVEEEGVAAEVEEVLGLLLDALRDRDTVVRWQAAKGIGRITARLPLVGTLGMCLSVKQFLLIDAARPGSCKSACASVACPQHASHACAALGLHGPLAVDMHTPQLWERQGAFTWWALRHHSWSSWRCWRPISKLVTSAGSV